MTSGRRLVTTHAVPIYFALTLSISWVCVLLVIAVPGGIPTSPLFLWIYCAMLAGPSVAGIVLTTLVHRTAGLRLFRSRLLNWRVGVRWYALALLTAPVLVTTTLLALSLRSADYLPGILSAGDTTSRLWFGIAVGLGAGTFEEIGWTGFAVPEVRRRHRVVATGVIVGMLWGAWHAPAVVWGIGDAVGTMPLALFVLVDLFSFLPAFRVLMVWVHDQTASLFVAMLMHASLTASMVILRPVAATGKALATYELSLGAMLWLVVGVISAVGYARSHERPPRTRAA